MKDLLQLIEENNYDWDYRITYEPTKEQIINKLKILKYDYEVTENDHSMQKVIDWLINCTPGYEEVSSVEMD